LWILGVADAGDDVLTLGVDEVVAVGQVLAGRGVAGEADARARALVPVAEHHRLHVHGGAQLVADLLAVAVRDRPRSVPRLEDRLHGALQLRRRVLRERLARLTLDDELVAVAELAKRVGGDVGVGGDAVPALGVLEQDLEMLALDVLHDPAVHRDEAAVRVVGEALVGLLGEPFDGFVVEAEVEDGVHHPRHRELGARADRDEERIGRVAELLAHGLLELRPLLGDLGVEPVGPAAVHVVAARVGADGEPRRHRQPQHRGHLGEVGALAPEQVLVGHRGLAVLVVEGEDVRHARDASERGSRAPNGAQPS
jgi:hypothetical protein